ncbi:AraC family transcriptional regulator [Paracoccus aminophilus]|uniref:Transcriptional regulator, AraC family n=1 Tax=Paracoccus aminophilus JCM 7686 TaxID=1367847 RepID=S5XUC4_PARAH|nr:helix-turn-helix transcriptional regulator [Paracoccus aminophilus]AGT08807.1 transcriptional regulator, AraC family [Paracoccus aminophilus JCM 7686]
MSPDGQRTIDQVEATQTPLAGFAQSLVSGHRTGRHAHARAHLLHVVDGFMRVEIGVDSYFVLPNTALFLPAGLDHDITFSRAAHLNTLFLRESTMAGMPESPRVIGLSPLMRELIAECTTLPLDGQRTPRSDWITALILHEFAHAGQKDFSLRVPVDTRVERLVQQVLSQPSVDMELESCAEIAHISSRTLTRIFQRETGMSFAQWRQQIRLIWSLNALAEGVSPKVVSALSCFASVSAFGVAFKRTFGFTPREAQERFHSRQVTRYLIPTVGTDAGLDESEGEGGKDTLLSGGNP